MRLGLIGGGLSHSYSKLIHEAMGDEYMLVELKTEELGRFISENTLDGFNVTIPHKKSVAAHLDFLSAEAASTGAVNTVFRREGKYCGFNTDIAGMEYALSRADIGIEGKNVLILGTGGTSESAIYLCRKLKASSITALGRDEISAVNKDGIDAAVLKKKRLADVDVLINATPIGMYPGPFVSPVPLAAFPSLTAVFDAIYNPLCTELVREANGMGLKTENGISMLAAQARYAHNLFENGKERADDDERVIEYLASLLTKKIRNIVLVGMPGCGKSTIGKALSDRLGKTFCDTDEMIRQKAGMSIPELFEKSGEHRFRDLETESILESSARTDSVIATGGGTVLRKANMDALKRNGIIVYIKRPLDRLDPAGRPLSKNTAALERMYNDRKSLYEAADITVENDSDTKSCVDKILEILK